MKSAKQPVSVLLCCAHSDANHVRPLVSKLEREGTAARLIEGIEDEPHLFGKALDDSPGATLFVVCLSDTLGPSHYRRLTGVYNARKGPSHYLADIIVEPDELDAMFEAIAAALVRAGKVIANPRRDKRQAKHGPAALREVVSVSTISAVDESAARSQTSPPRAARSQSAPRKSAPRKSKSDSKPQQDSARPREGSVAGPYVISTRKADAAASDSSPAADDSREPTPTPEEAKPRPSAGTGGLGPVVLFLILVAVAGTAMLVMQDREQDDTSASERGIPRPAVIEPTPAEPEPEPEPAEPEPAPEQPVDEAAVIREAIAAGELRAIDLILVANPEATANWRDASTACRAKSLRGVRGWRLPSLDELETIRDARMLDRDRYWSGTLATKHGDGSDHVYVLDVAARKLDPVAKDAADVRYLCVRAALP